MTDALQTGNEREREKELIPQPPPLLILLLPIATYYSSTHRVNKLLSILEKMDKCRLVANMNWHYYHDDDDDDDYDYYYYYYYYYYNYYHIPEKSPWWQSPRVGL